MMCISIVFLDLFFKGKRPQIEHDVEDDVIKLTTKFNHGDASHAWLSASGAMAGDQSYAETVIWSAVYNGKDLGRWRRER